jgi:hypothetical protein
MRLREWRTLPDEEQRRRCQNLDAYSRDCLFGLVESAFKKEYGNAPGVADVFCGMGPGVGPYNGIFVRIKRGRPRTSLPKYYLGFPVFRHYQKATGEWRYS